MNRKVRPLFTLVVSLATFALLCLASPAYADDFQVSISETGNPPGQVTWTGPNIDGGPATGGTWSFSFVIADNPTPIEYSTGEYTVLPVSDFTFTVNGVAIYGTPAAFEGSPVTELIFANGGASDSGGGFGNVATNDDFLTVDTVGQLYTGPESSPTVQLGDYAVSQVCFYNDPEDCDPSNLDITITPLTTTPEPSGLLLLGIGLLGLCAMAFWRKNAAESAAA